MTGPRQEHPIDKPEESQTNPYSQLKKQDQGAFEIPEVTDSQEVIEYRAAARELRGMLNEALAIADMPEGTERNQRGGVLNERLKNFSEKGYIHLFNNEFLAILMGKGGEVSTATETNPAYGMTNVQSVEAYITFLEQYQPPTKEAPNEY